MYTVDASVWVNAFDQREPGHPVSRQFLEVVRGQAVPIIVPNLVLAEVAGAISRTRQAPAQAQAFAIALSRLPHVTVRVLGEGCALHALTLAAEHGLRGADAVYTAALMAGIRWAMTARQRTCCARSKVARVARRALRRLEGQPATQEVAAERGVFLLKP